MYAHAIVDYDHTPIEQIPTENDLLKGTLNTLAWLTVLPKQVVEKLGRDRVLSVPAADVRAFGDDVALILTDRPKPYYDDEFQAAAAAVKEHLKS